mgnify:CR=1 FL=1
MATTAYQWEARSKNGDVKKGVMEAESEEAVLNRLKLQLLSPIDDDSPVVFVSPAEKEALGLYVSSHPLADCRRLDAAVRRPPVGGQAGDPAGRVEGAEHAGDGQPRRPVPAREAAVLGRPVPLAGDRVHRVV